VYVCRFSWLWLWCVFYVCVAACVVDGQYGVCQYILLQYVRVWKRKDVGMCMSVVLVGYGYGVSSTCALWRVLWMDNMVCVIIVCSSMSECEGVGVCMCVVMVGYGYGVSSTCALWCVLWMGNTVCVIIVLSSISECEGVDVCMCVVMVGYGYGVSSTCALWCVLWMGIMGMVCVLDVSHGVCHYSVF